MFFVLHIHMEQIYETILTKLEFIQTCGFRLRNPSTEGSIEGELFSGDPKDKDLRCQAFSRSQFFEEGKIWQNLLSDDYDILTKWRLQAKCQN